MGIRKLIVDNALFIFLLAVGLALAAFIAHFKFGQVVPMAIGRNSIYQIILQPVEGILTGIYIAIISIILWLRLRESDDALSKAFAKDKMWDEQSIVQFVRFFYPRYIESLVMRNCSMIKYNLTKSFRKKHTALIRAMTDRNQEYRSEILKIHKVEIIEVHDFKDNARDNFTAYIKVEKKKYYVINGELTVPLKQRHTRNFSTSRDLRARGCLIR